MNNGTSFDWRHSVRLGLILGAMVLYTGTIGMIVAFDGRQIIAGWLTLGQLLLFAPALAAGYLVARTSLKKEGVSRQTVLLGGTLAGAVTTVPILALIFLTTLINVRAMFANVSTALIEIVTLGQESLLIGGLLLALLMTAAGFVGAGVQYVPQHIRRPLTVGLFWTLGVGLLGDLLIQMIRSWFSGNAAAGRAVINTIFNNGALRPVSALILFIVTGGIQFLSGNARRFLIVGLGGIAGIFLLIGRVFGYIDWVTTIAIFLYIVGGSVFGLTREEKIKQQNSVLSEKQKKRLQYTYWAVGFLLLLALPWFVGSSLSDVATLVGLYVLMGLGLNIAVGLAGLLDLGYVTNFAVGAYVAGVLTTTGPLGGAELSFWVVLPISVLAAMTTGFIFALPVLRMRGDYLAIATLGFGEIIRLLALSDWLAPLIGGAQGVLFIPKPEIGSLVFQGPQEIYYIVLAGCLLMLFVSQRLNNSRTGRQWMAIREDEDVAAAMGINTIKAKLLAFTLSAASGGMAGAIFAVKLGTIFPHSFNLIISVSVLSLIIVGGMGSVPGVVVGAVALIGLLEVLREFSEFRLLIFGALLVVMMLARPEGLWPSAIRQRELKAHEDEDDVIPTQELGVTARG